MMKLYSRALLATAAGALAVLSQPASASIVAEAEPNDTLATAQNLDPNFSLDFDANITDSTTRPHSSIRAASADQSTYDWFSYTVVAAGVEGIFDIDAGRDDIVIELFDAGGNQIGYDDDNPGLDPGSTNIFDPYLVHTFASAGTFFVRVREFGNIPTDSNYILNVSLSATGVPEPGTWAMMLMGFGAAGFALRRNRSRSPLPATA